MLKEFIHSEEEAKIALLGTIIADGSIGKARNSSYRKTSFIEITHTASHRDYLVAKQELFDMIDGVTCDIKAHNKHTPNKTYLQFRLMTNCHKYFKELRDVFYDDNRIKILPTSIIEQLSPLSLYLMYLDDGCLKVRYRREGNKFSDARTEWSLDCFTEAEVNAFVDMMKRKYDITMRVYKCKGSREGRGYRPWTNTENTRKFMQLIDMYYDAVPSMRYKFLKFYSL